MYPVRADGSLAELGKFPAILSLSTFQSHILPFWCPVRQTLNLLSKFHLSQRLSSFSFFSAYFLSVVPISIVLSSSVLILPSALSDLLLSSFIEFFLCYCIFQA